MRPGWPVFGQFQIFGSLVYAILLEGVKHLKKLSDGSKNGQTNFKNVIFVGFPKGHPGGPKKTQKRAEFLQNHENP